ncbi:hypothetical protein NIES932_00190 [Raphidiopsis curvata NIES-932]|nr:hypothetical protein NIES932_00190 [Raphidiopsis curvata NIES-932]
MKLSSLCPAVAIALVTFSASIELGFAQDAASPPNKVTFFCHQLLDPASGEKAPTTVAWIPERQVHVKVIGWKSEVFGKNWTPQKRCDTVSPKFQAALESGRLKFLTHGKVQTPSKNGGFITYDVICGVDQVNRVCNSQNQLFTIKSTEEPDSVLKSLINTVQGRTTDPIWQSSDKNLYLDIKSYLNQAPVINLNP